MAESNFLTQPQFVLVEITAVMERELERRNVFPELRARSAKRMASQSTSLHEVAIERANDLLEDAKQQGGRKELARGVPVAYSALARNLERSLQAVAKHGRWDDPGKQEVLNRRCGSSALLSVGERVLYFFNGAEYGEKAQIVHGYDVYNVESRAGRYLSATGKTFDYLFGYIIKTERDSESFFVPAHELTREDCKPAHIQLVAFGGQTKQQQEFGRHEAR